MDHPTLQKALEVITEFCDKGRVGFLSGDLSKELIDMLADHVAFIETNIYDENQEIF
jgi:hypothetical protein